MKRISCLFLMGFGLLCKPVRRLFPGSLFFDVQPPAFVLTLEQDSTVVLVRDFPYH